MSNSKKVFKFRLFYKKNEMKKSLICTHSKARQQGGAWAGHLKFRHNIDKGSYFNVQFKKSVYIRPKKKFSTGGHETEKRHFLSISLFVYATSPYSTLFQESILSVKINCS